MDTNIRLGITLSGGGARGFAHIGVLKALETYGIMPEAISGTSMGAIVGALYADGKTPDEILEIVKQHKFSSFFGWNLPRVGFLNPKRLIEIVEEHLTAYRFEDLKMEFHVCATNLNTGEFKIFSKGPIIQPLVASAAIPILFSPVTIDGDNYVDGGLLNNLPIEPLKESCDKVIGVHVNRNGRVDQVNSMKAVGDRAFRIAIWQTVKNRLPLCDFVIEPTAVYEFGTFDFDKADDLVQKGFEEAENRIINLFSKFNIEKILEKKNSVLNGKNDIQRRN